MGTPLLLEPAEQTRSARSHLQNSPARLAYRLEPLNVVPGFVATAGRAVVDHPGVRMISLTGSTEVGKEISGSVRETCRRRPRLSLVGESPNIVFADADLDQATSTALFSFCVTRASSRSAATRLLVESTSTTIRFAARRQGRGAQDQRSPRSGYTAWRDRHPGAARPVERYVELGRSEGAELRTGGRRPTITGCQQRLVLQPDRLRRRRERDDDRAGRDLCPVLSVLRFDDELAACSLANDVIYGLAAGIWTRDIARAHHVAASIDAGLVYVNTMNVLTPAPRTRASSSPGRRGGRVQSSTRSSRS